MEHQFLISTDTSREKCLILPAEMADNLGAAHLSKVKLRFGSHTFTVSIQVSPDLNVNEASLSSDILECFNIPQHCLLQIQHRDNEFYIGPFIGFLAGSTKKSVQSKIPDLYDYLLHYQEIKGAIIAFSLETVNRENQTVEGYVYNPKKKRWDSGIFPYPSSIFIVTRSAGSKWINHFRSVIGKNVFNDFHLNKWAEYKRLSSSVEVKDCLPQTILYESPLQLYHFLIHHPRAFVKSMRSNGTSCYTLAKEKRNIFLTDPKRNELKVVRWCDKDQALTLFETYFKKRQYMIQESFDFNILPSINLRIIVVKNGQEHWQAMGMFARGGLNGNAKGSVNPFIKVEPPFIKEFLQVSDLMAGLYIQEITHLALESVKALEGIGGHLANAAIDMTLDQKGEIWIRDIHHTNPSHEIALIAGHPEIYYQTLKNNMLYAKMLAGF